MKMHMLLVSTAAIQTPPEKYGGMERAVYWLARAIKQRDPHVKITLCAKTGSRPGGAADNLVEGDSEQDFVDRVKWEIDKFSIIVDFSHDKVMTRTFGYKPQLNVYQVMEMSNPNNPVFISYAQMEHMASKGHNVENAPVIYYGLDVEEYPTDLRPRDNYMLYMGSLIPEKRPHLVAEAAQIVGCPAYLIGPMWDPSYHAKLDELRDMAGVTVMNDIGGAEKLTMLQRAACLVHPVGGNNWVEAGALIVRESMLVGTPVIGSRNGCLPEYIIEGENGFFAETAEEIAAAYSRLHELSPVDVSCSLSSEHFASIMALNYLELCKNVIAGEKWGG